MKGDLRCALVLAALAAVAGCGGKTPGESGSARQAKGGAGGVPDRVPAELDESGGAGASGSGSIGGTYAAPPPAVGVGGSGALGNNTAGAQASHPAPFATGGEPAAVTIEPDPASEATYCLTSTTPCTEVSCPEDEVMVYEPDCDAWFGVEVCICMAKPVPW